MFFPGDGSYDLPIHVRLEKFRETGWQIITYNMNPSLNVITITFKEILPEIIYLRINIRPHHNLYIFNSTLLRVAHALALKFCFILNPDLCM